MNDKHKNFSFLKAGFVSILIALTGCSVIFSAQAINESAIINFVIDELDLNKDDCLIYQWGPITEGIEVHSISELITITYEDCSVIYIDPDPRSNALHPVHFVIVTSGNQIQDSFISNSAPRNLFDYRLIDTEIGRIHAEAENRRAPLPKTSEQSIMDGVDSRWAVLMNGGYGAGSNHIRYWNDLSNIYITINQVYGFLDEQIIVLCSDGLDPAPDQSNGQNSPPDLDGDGDDDIMYSCVLSNVDMVFSDLADTLKPNDKLFVFATDHGSSQGGWDTLFNLWNAEELLDDHFASLLAALPSTCEVICTFEPCFSGGFLDDVVVPPGPVVASSACRHDEYSWAMSNLEYDEYVFHWTAAVKGEDAYGVPVDADSNQDGIVTMDEAFIYAETHDVANEEPQYGDYPEGIGAELSLWISNSAPEKPIITDGPNQGIIQEEYSFSANTTDEENEQISYLFEWGDGTTSGWIGPVNSGQMVSASHVWTDSGDYNISVKAKDINDQESEWSDPLTIHITKPVLEIRVINGGVLKVSCPIRNTGEAAAENVNWSIVLDGGIILTGKESTGTIPSIEPGDVATIQTGMVLGLGKTRVYVTVDNPLGAHDTRDQGANLFLFFVNVFPGGG